MPAFHMKEEFHKKRIKVFFFASGFTVTMVALLGGAGWLLDSYFDTNHRYLIIGFIVAYPLTQYILYRKYRGNK